MDFSLRWLFEMKKLAELGCRISGEVVKKDDKPDFRMKRAFLFYLKLETKNIISP